MAKGGKGGLYALANTAPQIEPPKDFVPIVPTTPGSPDNFEDVHSNLNVENEGNNYENAQYINFKKELYGAASFKNHIDKNFQDFDNGEINRNIREMFQIYNDNFFDIPKSVLILIQN